jgi:hypothetical protein
MQLLLKYPQMANAKNGDSAAYVAWLFQHANPDGLVT